MLNQLVRYASVLPMLREETGTIAEIGSGAEGISAYLRRPIVGVEIRFPGPTGPFLRPVGGSATHLPFADASIDVVLIMDTIEHIPPALRARSLSEAMRVARHRIIIGGPMGARARTADDALAAWYQKRGIEIPDWLAEHLEQHAPDLEDVVAPLRDAGWSVRSKGNENLPLHLALMRLETRSLGYRVLGRIRRHAQRPALALARTMSVGPYYSWLVEATRDQTSSTRATSGSQS